MVTGGDDLASRGRVSDLLAPHEVLWPDPHQGPWLVTAVFGQVDQRPEVVGLSLQSLGTPELLARFGDSHPAVEHALPRALTAEVWRSLPVGRLTAQARASWKGALQESGLLSQSPAAAELWKSRRRLGGVDLELVADVYLQALQAGRSPTKAVQEAFGPMSKSAAAQRVSRAREAGFLAPTARGRSSGQPPPASHGPAAGPSS